MNAAPQRNACHPLRPRGPHPLAVFLAHVAAQCGDDHARLDTVMAGLRRYQAAPHSPPRPPGRVVAQSGSVTLRDSSNGCGRPVVLVPSLINSPDILDLAPGNSLVEALSAAGHRPLIIDWGRTEPHGLAAAVSQRLVPLVQAIGEPVAIVGYCLGGTLAIAAAALLGSSVTRLALMATPWHFGGYGPDARSEFAAWWAATTPLAEQLGSVPMDILQPAFWALDPAALTAKYARLGAGAGPTDAFVRLEDWTNSGAPLSIATANDLAKTLFADDATGNGCWTIDGLRIVPEAIACPIIDIIAARDRIVPAATALTVSGPGLPLRIDAGHVGMVAGSRASDRLWNPLAAWLHR